MAPPFLSLALRLVNWTAWPDVRCPCVPSDVLFQAPRHHPAWELLSTAGTGLLVALVRTEGATEAAQPQALGMLLNMLESDRTCGTARQAVAAVLHCLVAQRTAHRDKLLAAGALPALLRVLRRLDVLCDLIAVQELLWVLAYLTEEGASPLAGAGSSDAEFQSAAISQLVPLLSLYSMPEHAQHAHLAALSIRVLHVQVASSDLGKDVLRTVGALPVLIDLVRRHSAPYTAAAEAFAQHANNSSSTFTHGFGGREGLAAAAAAQGGTAADGAQGQQARAGAFQRFVTHGSLQFGPVRPPAHQECEVHVESTPVPRAGSDNEEEQAEDDGVGAEGRGRDTGPAAASATPVADPWATRVIEGARVACCGLLLPLLLETGDGTAAGGGGATAGAGAVLRRRLCPLREALATLKTIMCDCEANQLKAWELGLVPLLVQLMAHGDMGLAWQAAEAAVFLSTGSTGTALMQAGAVEELAYLLQESAEALHGLTIRKQIHLQANNLAGADTHGLGVGRGRRAARSSLNGSGSAGSGLASVHVRPGPEPPLARPQRLYLVGRLPLDFTTSSSCFYGSHDSASYCDYCTPSAAIKALLRLLTAPGSPTLSAAVPMVPAAVGSGSRERGRYGGSGDAGEGSEDGEVGGDGNASEAAEAATAAEVAVCRRFASAGGLYGVLQLLHHEAAGVHHSKLAASLLSLTDRVLLHHGAAQDELRAAGGLGVLAALLESLLRPGVMDIYQLRVATCRTLGLALAGNAANKLAAREHGLLPLLVSLMAGLAERRKASVGEVVLDDDGFLAAALLDALATAAHDSPGTQEALLALGLMHPVCQYVKDERLETAVRTAAVRTLAAMVNEHPAGQRGALALDVVKPAVAWLERHCSVHVPATPGVPAELMGPSHGGTAAAPGGGPAAARLAEVISAAELSLAMTELLAALVQGSGSGNIAAAAVRAAIVSAGALPVLVGVLRKPHIAICAGASYTNVDAHCSRARELAAGLMASLADGDVDLQNELVSQGALAAAAEVLRDGSTAAPQALQLLSAVLRSNTFAKNTARGSGLHGTLVDAARRCGLARSAATAAAVGALSEMAAGNHANQEAIAVEGGLEVAVELARDACAALPFALVRGADAAAGEGALQGAESFYNSGGAKVSSNGERPLPHGGSAVGAAVTPGALVPEPVAATVLPGVAPGGHFWAAAAASDAAAAMAVAATAAAEATTASLSRLLKALFGLLCACAELNAGNQNYVRELGGVGLLGEFLTTASEALTVPLPAPPPPRQLAHSDSNRSRSGHGPDAATRLRSAALAARAAVSPAVAAACGAVSALARDCSANLERLEEHPDLPISLFKLLVASDAATSAAAAGAIEWLVLRSGTQLDAPSREAFELNLVDLLVLALYVPYGPSAVHPSAGAEGAGHPGPGAAAVEQTQQRHQPRTGPWHTAVTARMPAEGLAATAVRDAVSLLAAVADAADSLAAAPQAHQQQQQAAKAGAAGKAALGKERRRQVVWMIFLLVVRSADNRARLRQLVRTSLTPLAQQLGNAEACRAQLEAAAVLTPGSSSARPPSGSGPAPYASAMGPMSSAALESASSLKGRLPISTAALVVTAPGSPQLGRGTAPAVQVSAGGSSVMSDDDEISMIQQVAAGDTSVKAGGGMDDMRVVEWGKGS
ncbi:hypothetical protein GPECTOR_11g148 [Gonium pectorale]|uniref:Uncharacterized protein n=1 Tax=Gonium pectorale TaxID=33097 RepID=A0A150GPN7_GONPE|nr:hypothetical protein GPECTOR_11g148 [Gonium pectorale]|eukprot:KXZ51698.1 hypothetical protein GPECTOR_11g148 [Gonium pectorale]